MVSFSFSPKNNVCTEAYCCHTRKKGTGPKSYVRLISTGRRLLAAGYFHGNL